MCQGASPIAWERQCTVPKDGCKRHGGMREGRRTLTQASWQAMSLRAAWICAVMAWRCAAMQPARAFFAHSLARSCATDASSRSSCVSSRATSPHSCST